MEKEKIVVVLNGLNEKFYAELIAQAEAIMDSESEDAMINASLEQLEADQGLDDYVLEASVKTFQDQFGRYEEIDMDSDEAMEDAYISQMEQGEDLEDYADQMEPDEDMEDYSDQMEPDEDMADYSDEMEPDEDMMADYFDQMEAEEMMENGGYYGGSKPDKQIDTWIAIYNDFTTKSSEIVKNLNTNNLLCFIHKKYDRHSKTGKTAYFSYHIKDKNLNDTRLKVGDYTCGGAEAEHWVAWKYENQNIKEEHYLTIRHEHSRIYDYERTFIFPLGYSFASLVSLSNYNPLNFSFRKLNFLSKDSISSCGDKLARVRIYNKTGKWLELSIYDFENNILEILKEISNSVSFIDFLVKIHLKQSIKYLEQIKTDLTQKADPFAKITFKAINDNIKKMLFENSRFLPYSVKNNVKSEVNILSNQFALLVNDIHNLN